MNIAYIRVSTVEQNDGRQIEGLKKYNIDKKYSEKVSAKDKIRSELKAKSAKVIRISGYFISLHNLN